MLPPATRCRTEDSWAPLQPCCSLLCLWHLQADQLPGGIDGIYTLVSCKNGRPMYRRKESPPGEDRVLWYSHQYGDWDIAKGTEPNEVRPGLGQRCWCRPG